MSLLVCSFCQASIPDDSPHCPTCGPQSLTLSLSEEPGASAASGQPELARRLAHALGPRYEVTGLRGRGGFAEVYEVKDTDLQRRLAVKTLRPDIAWTSGMLARFKQEARAIARLSHPHTVPIYFVGESDGLAFYAMPYVEGRSLAALLREEGALDPERAIDIAAPIFDALQHAHQHGLVHRDIKPDNIMLEAATGRPLLVDFGIVKSLDDQAQHTQTGFVVGTPLYMSPEQALGQRNVDARADVYAMGVMLYQMLTGAPPFEGTTSQEIVSKHLTTPAPNASSSNRRIPTWLSEVIVRCMAKRPADRYASAALALEALERGRRSGSDEAITASRLVARVSAEATPTFHPADSPAPAPPPGDAATALICSPAVPRPAAPTAEDRGSRWPLIAAAVIAVAIAAAAGRGAYATLVRPRLFVANHLLQPVRIAIDSATEVTVAAGDSVRVTVSRASALAANWAAVRPVSAGGEPMGDEMRGVIVAQRPRGEIRHRIDAASAGRRYFAPLVTNTTGAPLRVTITDSSGAARGCDCLVPPHRPAAHLGYWPLSGGASVIVTDASGRTLRFDSLSAHLEPGSGALALQVASGDLPATRDVPRPRPVRSGAGRAKPPISSATSTSDASPAFPRPAPAPRSAKKSASSIPEPLRGIFPRR